MDRAAKRNSILIAYLDNLRPPMGAAPRTIYGVDLPTLRYIAAARNLSAQTRTGETVLDYELWQDGRPALGQRLRRLTE